MDKPNRWTTGEAKRHIGTANTAEPRPHRWASYKPRKRSKWAGLNWMTGEPIPNTLDEWVASAVRGKRGVVLDAAKTMELANRLALLDRLLGHIQGDDGNSSASLEPPSSTNSR